MTAESQAPRSTSHVWGFSGTAFLLASAMLLRVCLVSGRLHDRKCSLLVLCGEAAAVVCSVFALGRGSFWWGLFIIPAVYVVVYAVFYTIVGDL